MSVVGDNLELSPNERNVMAKYNVTVPLSEIDGNAFSIMGAVTKQLRRAGASKEEQDEYFTEATSGDYHHLIATTMKWVDVS
jgi:hypothetical protein